jgi:hypothetical protein
MHRGWMVAILVVLVPAFGCDPADGSRDAAADVQGDAASACGGATSTVLAGSCTYTAAGLTTCAEDYYGHALSGTERDVYTQACSGSGFTLSTTATCPTTDVACQCVDTSSLFKRIRYGYGTYADACGTCTGDCYSRQ